MFSSEEKIISDTKPKKKVTFFKYNFLDLNGSILELYNPNLKLFELKTLQKYPLGHDSFIIDHGKDYFAFFKRLGEINYLIIQDNDNKTIVGTACAIIRKYFVLPLSSEISQTNDTGNKIITDKTKKHNIGKISFWYLCDLKIDEAHRGQNLTSKIFMNMYHKYMCRCHRGYLISMDPNSTQIIHIFNKIDKILHTNNIQTKLLIYSVSIIVMKEIERFFNCMFGDISYISLAGTKDLILTSTNKPMEIYHLQHSSFAAISGTKKINDIPENSTVMFCFPKNSPLEKILDDFNIKTDISATIISWSMKFFDWHNILTSDI